LGTSIQCGMDAAGGTARFREQAGTKCCILRMRQFRTVLPVLGLGVIIENSDYQRLASELRALTAIAKAITSPLGLPDLLDAVMQTITQVVETADIGAIMLWDQSTGLLRPAAAVGYDFEILKEIGLRPGESITGKVYKECQARLLDTPESVSQAMADMRPFNRDVMARSIGTDALPMSAMAAPIFVADRKFGVLVLESLDHRNQSLEEDLPFLQSIADLVALAIEREQLETRADTMRDAQQAQRMRSEVMATLSHELRMPLSAIKGYATALMLEEISWSDTQRNEFLHQIVGACDDMESMVLEMLDSALIEVAQLKPEWQPVHLKNIAREMATELQQKGKTHRFVVDFPPDFPIVNADPRWIKQVFRNILDNAVKYAPDGGLIVIKGEARSSDVVISIADQGIGISPEDMVSLFEKYFRVRSVATLHVHGTGLGLPIARAIVEAHGGRIWAESKVGEGTSISFSLPRPQSIIGVPE
jgi:K+-sensing histidine kinase KdpD